MYTYVLDLTECPACHVNLAGEGTVRVEGDLQSVTDEGRVVENPPAGDDPGTDLCLDYRAPDIKCAACGQDLYFSYNQEN